MVGILLLVSVFTGIVTSQSPDPNAEPTYNYGEVLQKAIFFYEAQRSGKLPSEMRLNWRGDSGLNDGAEHNLDLTGGWYDAGDHVKFNLPMAYSVSMLGWNVYENRAVLEQTGQLQYLLENMKWAVDYLIKCHTGPKEFYYQVGEGGSDHSWWGPCEVMPMERPSYKVTAKYPGSTVVGETAAALAVASLAFRPTDPEFADQCLDHAKSLFKFADKTKSDAGYLMAEGFYKSWNGFYDELSWAATWLYLATQDNAYLKKAESYVSKWQTTGADKTIHYQWTHCWDDKHYGAGLLLARITGKPIYQEFLEHYLDWWTVGYQGERIEYQGKLAWLAQWGSLRYSTTTAFLASIYANWSGCTPNRVEIYREFAKSQVDYALGSNSMGRSFVVGFGNNPPQHPHHRTAHGSWNNSLNTPEQHRHTIYGALVGGPGVLEAYNDTINNYVSNEVACDYNAGFVGALTEMVRLYGGTPIPDFNGIEPITSDEFFVEAKIIASESNFTEISAYLYNQSAWPARSSDQLAFRLYFDLSELLNNGYQVSDLKLSSSSDEQVVVSELTKHSDSIYYVVFDFSGIKLFPGGPSDYRKEIQFRITAPEPTGVWNMKSAYSLQGLSEENYTKTTFIPVYDNGQLIFGKEP